MTYLHKGTRYTSLAELTTTVFCITCTQHRELRWCYVSHMDKQQLDDVVIKSQTIVNED